MMMVKWTDMGLGFARERTHTRAHESDNNVAPGPCAENQLQRTKRIFYIITILYVIIIIILRCNTYVTAVQSAELDAGQ